MRRSLWLVVVVMLVPVLSWAQLQNILGGGRRPPPFMHPTGLYALSLPGGWTYRLQQSGALVAHKTSGDQAELSITLKRVPAGADTEMVALNTGRELRKLPHYRAGGGGKLILSGKPASIRSFEFDYKGNTEYTVSVEELYIVTGTILVQVHFEVMKRSLAKFKMDLAEIYDSLAIADLDASGQVLAPVQPKATNSGSVMVPNFQ